MADVEDQVAPELTVDDFLGEVEEASPDKGSITEMTNRALSVQFIGKILDNTKVRNIFLRAGINKVWRERKKHGAGKGGDSGIPSTQQQLLLWSEGARVYVEAIDRYEVFFPEQKKWGTLTPDKNEIEVRDAGEHLINHGAGCIRRGRLLMRLADWMHDNQP